MGTIHPAALIVTVLAVLTGSCIGSPCHAAVADTSPLDYRLPDTLAASLLHALQALALAGSSLGAGPLVIGSARRPGDHQLPARDAMHQFAHVDSGFRTIVGATPAAGVVGLSLAQVIAFSPTPALVDTFRAAVIAQ